MVTMKNLKWTHTVSAAVLLVTLLCVLTHGVVTAQQPVIAGSFQSPLDGLDLLAYTGIPNDVYSTVWRGKYRAADPSGFVDSVCSGESSGRHSGVDIPVSGGTPVRAVAAGIVVPTLLNDWDKSKSAEQAGWAW